MSRPRPHKPGFLDADLRAMFVDTTFLLSKTEPKVMADIKGLSGIGQKLLNKKIVNGVLYADDMKFPAVKSRVGAVVLYVGNAVLGYQDGIRDSPTSPRGGDLDVPFSQRVIAFNSRIDGNRSMTAKPIESPPILLRWQALTAKTVLVLSAATITIDKRDL